MDVGQQEEVNETGSLLAAGVFGENLDPTVPGLNRSQCGLGGEAVGERDRPRSKCLIRIESVIRESSPFLSMVSLST